jgi:hypothetical protein
MTKKKEINHTVFISGDKYFLRAEGQTEKEITKMEYERIVDMQERTLVARVEEIRDTDNRAIKDRVLPSLLTAFPCITMSCDDHGISITYNDVLRSKVPIPIFKLDVIPSTLEVSMVSFIEQVIPDKISGGKMVEVSAEILKKTFEYMDTIIKIQQQLVDINSALPKQNI